MPAKGNLFQDVDITTTFTPSGACLLSAVPIQQQHQAQQQQQQQQQQQLPQQLPQHLPQSGGAAAAAQKDVDHLVQEIKENLKLGPMGLKAAAAASAARRQKAYRASPYSVPPSSRVGGAMLNHCDSRTAAERQSQLRKWNHQRRRYPSTCKSGASDDTLDDPFEMLQELITDGSLIKEAVRRLQLGLTPKYAAPTSSAGGNNNKNRSFYDSDEECRTPPAYPDMLCEVGGGI